MFVAFNYTRAGNQCERLIVPKDYVTDCNALHETIIWGAISIGRVLDRF